MIRVASEPSQRSLIAAVFLVSTIIWCIVVRGVLPPTAAGSAETITFARRTLSDTNKLHNNPDDIGHAFAKPTTTVRSHHLMHTQNDLELQSLIRDVQVHMHRLHKKMGDRPLEPTLPNELLQRIREGDQEPDQETNL